MAFYLLMIRPQQRRRQQAAQKKETIQPGARVRTTAGMYATVVDVDGDDVVLEIAPGIEVRYMKRAVMDVVSGPEADDAPADETDTDYFDAEHADDADDVDHVMTWMTWMTPRSPPLPRTVPPLPRTGPPRTPTRRRPRTSRRPAPRRTNWR